MQIHWEDQPLSYALVATPKHRIIHVDDILDYTEVICIGSWNDCDRCAAEIYADAYQRELERFEIAYEKHIEDLARFDY